MSTELVAIQSSILRNLSSLDTSSLDAGVVSLPMLWIARSTTANLTLCLLESLLSSLSF